MNPFRRELHLANESKAHLEGSMGCSRTSQAT